MLNFARSLGYFSLFETFYGIFCFNVVKVFDANPTLYSGFDLLDFFFKALELLDSASIDDDTVANEANGIVFLEVALGDVATCHCAYAGYFKGFFDYGIACGHFSILGVVMPLMASFMWSIAS